MIDDYNQSWQGWTSLQIAWETKVDVLNETLCRCSPPTSQTHPISIKVSCTKFTLLPVSTCSDKMPTKFWFDFVVCYVNVPGCPHFILLCISKGTCFSLYCELPKVPAFHVILHFQRYLLFMCTCFLASSKIICLIISASNWLCRERRKNAIFFYF